MSKESLKQAIYSFRPVLKLNEPIAKELFLKRIEECFDMSYVSNVIDYNTIKNADFQTISKGIKGCTLKSVKVEKITFDS